MLCAILGGTALPICFLWDSTFPLNSKLSGKDCKTADSLTVINRDGKGRQMLCPRVVIVRAGRFDK